jgi:hypothetical protein
MDQLVMPYCYFQDYKAQTAIPQKLNQFIKEKFNPAQERAIRSIAATTSKEFVCFVSRVMSS